ncbi:nucleotidyl transferase AbiEii/AbiGii toxin family protein [Deferribacter abyssi]|uniref:nucleotidyl transferase AbiEii/AbiGii toxin family protein n=1 Tax=Deferribacter abyssi TaxID=213806 RepID=UPI003C1E7771
MKDLKNLNFLLPKTKKVLLKLIKEEYMSNFVLVGGSALALHIQHRKSEDLDFFTFQKDRFEIKKIRKIVERFEGKVINISGEQVDVLIDGVKVTFFDAKWFFLRPKKIQNFNLATLSQLAIMKTNVLFLAKYRDYYDLYFLVKKFGVRSIFEMSKDVIEGINFKLFAAALLYIDDIDDENIDHLEPIKKLSLKEIQKFFEEELKKVLKESELEL